MSNLELIEQIAISTNDYAGTMFTEILISSITSFLLIVLLLYFGGLALSFLKNI